MGFRSKANQKSLTSFNKLSASCFVIMLYFYTHSFANTYYISLKGSDNNNGSIAQPWLTVMKAVRKTIPGDTILLRGGFYPKQEEIWIRGKYKHSGQINNWKTIKAFPGEIVILSQRVIINADYIRIQGLHFSNGNTISAVEWDGPTSYVEILDNYFTGPYHVYSGAVNYKGSHGLIQGNRLELSPTGSATDLGIYIMSGSNNIVRNNYVSGMTGYGIHIYDEDKYGHLGQHNPKITNLIVENNFVTRSQSRSGIIISAGESTSKAIEIDSVIVRNNIIVTNPQSGIDIRLFGKVRNIDIYNNVFHDNEYGVYIRANDVDDIAIINNIFSLTNKKHIWIENVNNIIVSNNLYWQPQSMGLGAKDPNAICGDPLFIDVSGNNFHLKVESPAIDAGMELGFPYLGVAPDIGAFEYEHP